MVSNDGPSWTTRAPCSLKVARLPCDEFSQEGNTWRRHFYDGQRFGGKKKEGKRVQARIRAISSIFPEWRDYKNWKFVSRVNAIESMITGEEDDTIRYDGRLLITVKNSSSPLANFWNTSQLQPLQSLHRYLGEKKKERTFVAKANINWIFV